MGGLRRSYNCNIVWLSYVQLTDWLKHFSEVCMLLLLCVLHLSLDLQNGLWTFGTRQRMEHFLNWLPFDGALDSYCAGFTITTGILKKNT